LVRHLLRGHDAFAQDVASGQVESVEGAITKKSRQAIGDPSQTGAAPPSFRIWIANPQAGNQEFKCDAELYESAPSGGIVRLFRGDCARRSSVSGRTRF
jgi:hypothetical protein